MNTSNSTSSLLLLLVRDALRFPRAEGSGYYIASTAVRRIFQALDRFSAPPQIGGAPPAIPDVTRAHALMLDFFKVRLSGARHSHYFCPPYPSHHAHTSPRS